MPQESDVQPERSFGRSVAEMRPVTLTPNVMKNADGSTGAHWTLDQTTELMQRRGINCNPVKFWVAMNAVYSDLSEVAERHGVGNDEFYADMAKSFWLCDKDAVEDKLAAYYENVVKHN